MGDGPGTRRLRLVAPAPVSRLPGDQVTAGFRWSMIIIRPGFPLNPAIFLLPCSTSPCSIEKTGKSRSFQSGWTDSNRRPPDPQSGALTKLRYSPSEGLKAWRLGEPGHPAALLALSRADPDITSLQDSKPSGPCQSGQGGIRTHGTDKPYTAFPVPLLQPLGHLSVLDCVVYRRERIRQDTKAIDLRNTGSE